MHKVTGYDIQQYLDMVRKAELNHITVSVIGDGFQLTMDSDQTSLGRFETVNDIFHYLCGYETGISKGGI